MKLKVFETERDSDIPSTQENKNEHQPQTEKIWVRELLDITARGGHLRFVVPDVNVAIEQTDQHPWLRRMEIRRLDTI